MAGERLTDTLRRGSVTFWLAVPEAVADWQNPTATELNTTNERLVLDITCAVDEESTTFNIGASELNERLGFCDGAGVERPAGLNPEIEMGFYRDKDRNATGVFNKVLDFVKHVDVPLYLIQRVGDQDRNPGDPINTTTDHLRIVSVLTDFPQDTLSGEDPALLVQAFKEAGFVRWNLPVAA